MGKQKAKHWEEQMVYCMVEMKEEKKADWKEEMMGPPREWHWEPSSGHRTVPRSVPRWDCSSESPWEHRKEHWRAPRSEHWTEDKSGPPREWHWEPSSGHRTVPRSVPRWDCSSESPWEHRKEHWRAPRSEHWTVNKSGPPRARHWERSSGHRTVPRSVPRWDCSSESPWVLLLVWCWETSRVGY